MASGCRQGACDVFCYVCSTVGTRYELNKLMATFLSKLLTSLGSKPVLVLNFDYERAGVKYKDVLNRALTCVFATWDDISFVNGQVQAVGKPLTEFSYIIFGTVAGNNVPFIAMRECAAKCGVPFFTYGQSDESCGKILQSVRFSAHGVSQPKTVICFADPERADSLINELKLPLVTKITDGSQGRGIEKHETKESLVKALKSMKGKELIVQEALTTSCDYRVFFIHEELVYTMRRSSTKKGEFRHNLSLGGKYDVIENPEPEIVELAKAAQKAMGFDISGVDVIQDDETKKWYCLEVNAAPQFITPNRIIEKLIELVKQRIG